VVLGNRLAVLSRHVTRPGPVAGGPGSNLSALARLLPR
jgi:hypothetical protein